MQPLEIAQRVMKSMRSAAMWIVWNIPFGSLAPRLLAFAMNCRSYARVSGPRKTR